MNEVAREIIYTLAWKRGLDPADILGRSRKMKLLKVRIEIAKLLDARGYSSPQIGAILDRDHTTVIYYLGRGKRCAAKPRWKAPKVRHLSWERVPPVERRRFYLVPYAGADWTNYEWKERRA